MSLFFDSQTLSVKRPIGAGQFVKGRWISGAKATPFNITGSVQPTSGYQLKSLLEGKRVTGIIEIICDTQLFAADPLTGKSGDILHWDNFDWEVIQTLSWKNQIIPHFESFAIREKEGD